MRRVSMNLDLAGWVQITGAAAALVSGVLWIYSGNKQVPLRGVQFLSGPPRSVQEAEHRPLRANGLAAWFAGAAALCQATSTFLALTAPPPKCDQQSCINHGERR